VPIFLDLTGVSDYCNNAVCKRPGSIYSPAADTKIKWLRNLFTAEREGLIFQEKRMQLFKKKTLTGLARTCG
jgi:hypothetical protein